MPTPASPDALRAQLSLPGAMGSARPGSTIPDAIVAAVTRYTRGLEELQQQLGRPVPWKWRCKRSHVSPG